MGRICSPFPKTARITDPSCSKLNKLAHRQKILADEAADVNPPKMSYFSVVPATAR
jgi:hypothetical protein